MPTYTPNINDARQDEFAPVSFDDPIDYPAPKNRRVDSKFALKPWQDELLGLIAGRISSKVYLKEWTCDSGLTVGAPVRISADDTVELALATDAAHAMAIGFVRYKPTSTTCYLDHFYFLNGLTGTAGAPVYLQDDGSFGASPGTFPKGVGAFQNTTDAWLSAIPSIASIPARTTPRAAASGLQTIPDSTTTLVSFTSEDYDTDAMIDIGGAPTVITIQTPGLYQICANAYWDSSAGEHQLFIYKNGGSIVAGSVIPATSANVYHSCSAQVQCAVSDTFSIYVSQNSGGSLNLYNIQLQACLLARDGE